MRADDVLEEIQEAGDELGTLAPSLSEDAKGKAYEVWIAFEIATRLLRHGYDVRAVNPFGAPEPSFKVRGSPGGMTNTATRPTSPPTHFEVRGGDRELELHIGLQLRGLSGATHEVDVTVLPAEIGRFVRSHGGGPYNGPLDHGYELKAYDEKHKLGQGFPRALLGIAADINPSWFVPELDLRIANGQGSSVQLMQRTRFALLTTTTFYENSRSLMAGHDILGGAETLPGHNEAILDHLIGDLVLRLSPPRPVPAPRPRRVGRRLMV